MNFECISSIPRYQYDPSAACTSSGSIQSGVVCVKFRLVKADSRVKQGDIERQVSSRYRRRLLMTSQPMRPKKLICRISHASANQFPSPRPPRVRPLSWPERNPNSFPGHPRRRKMRNEPCTARLDFCNMSQERNGACVNE